MLTTVTAGAAGATTVNDATILPTALRYYHAISASHDDPVGAGLRLTIEIEDLAGGSVPLAEQPGSQADEQLIISRPIVLGENKRIRVRVPAIGGANLLILRTYSIQQGLGGPLPGL